MSSIPVHLPRTDAIFLIKNSLDDADIQHLTDKQIQKIFRNLFEDYCKLPGAVKEPSNSLSCKEIKAIRIAVAQNTYHRAKPQGKGFVPEQAVFIKHLPQGADAEREYSIHSKLSGQKGILNLLGRKDTKDSVQLLLERGDGTVRGYLSTCSNRFKNALYCAVECAEALETVHLNKIVHRDVKGSNFIVAGQVVRLADFGSASRDPGLITSFTPAFAAPEYFRDSLQLSSKADVWSFGCLLIELFLGNDLESDNDILPWGTKEIESPRTSGDMSVDSSCTPAKGSSHPQIISMREFLTNPPAEWEKKLPDLGDSILNNILKRIFQLDPKTRPTITDIKKALIYLKAIL